MEYSTVEWDVVRVVYFSVDSNVCFHCRKCVEDGSGDFGWDVIFLQDLGECRPTNRVKCLYEVDVAYVNRC